MNLPPVIFGTSCLGNLYQATSYENKLNIVAECIKHAPNQHAVFDTAGKYGAGMSLEVLGKCLNDLSVPPNQVTISNKLGWVQTPLLGDEPTFEKGVWHGLKNDAEQKISYDGILECYHQGNQLLGNYHASMVSVHDPDEYLAAATSAQDAEKRLNDIVAAYDALLHLKETGAVQSVGVGAKNWKVIQQIEALVPLDWIMFANSLTIHTHPADLLAFVASCHQKGIIIINSAVFNGGFLTGSDFYNYALVDKSTEQGKALYDWRDTFFGLCKKHEVLPAEVCFNYAFQIPGVKSIALNTSKPEKVAVNVAMATKQIPAAFWEEAQLLLHL